MLVVINGQVFDPNDAPILIVLDGNDKKNIRDMGDQRFYLAFPSKSDKHFAEKTLARWKMAVRRFEEKKPGVDFKPNSG